MARFTFIDLFAGIGGFRLALESLGGTCIGFSEISKDAINAYTDNFGEGEDANFGDITKLKDLPPHDFMTAGVPCQSWSIAGKNLGFDDDRGQLWNDTLYLLNKSRPKAFIFENVKGLADPRNHDALAYILGRIKEAGYHAGKFVLNAHDYGVPQTRVRIYVVGFKEVEHFRRFELPAPLPDKPLLSSVLDGFAQNAASSRHSAKPRWSLSCNDKGFNNYFLFNDLRNGPTTIHSWDICDTTDRQKAICMLLLQNRRKKAYGSLDGNPLSLKHFRQLDPTISQRELDALVEKGILKEIGYIYEQTVNSTGELSDAEMAVLSEGSDKRLCIDVLKNNRGLKLRKVNVADAIARMESKGVVRCVEKRYDFKNTKISTGLFGINRIFQPSSDIYPTLVASDTNDYVTPVSVDASSLEEYRQKFLAEVYHKGAFRQITKTEACRIQGFPPSFRLPQARARWMHLLGNSVAVPVVRQLAWAVAKTGVFGDARDGVSESAMAELRHGRKSANGGVVQLCMDF